MKKLLAFLLFLVILAYPFIIYFGLGHFSPRYIATAIAFVFLLRFIFMQHREAKFSRVMLLLITGAGIVISLLGFISNSSLMIKLYPVVINLLLCGIFCYSIIYPPTIIERIARITNSELLPAAISYTKKVTIVWVGFFIINALIALWTTLFASMRTWTIYNGFIAYILIGILFVAEFICRQFVKRKQPDILRILKRNKTLVSDISSFIAEFNITTGKRYALYFQDGYEFSVALFAVLAVGGVPILLPNNQSGTLREFSAEYDVVLNENVGVRRALPAKTKIKLKPDQKIVFFTSGSTGKPQKVVRTLRELNAEITALETAFGRTVGKNSVYSTVSQQHMYGLLFYILWPLCTGRTIVVPTLHYPEQVAAIIYADPKITLISSPSLLHRMKLGECSATIFSSGGFLDRSLVDNLEIIDVFGSTETGGIGYRRIKEDCWIPFSQVEICLTNEGFLKVKSPFFELTELAMADRAEIVNGSKFKLLGRGDRTAKIEGKRVSLVAIEQRLAESELIQQAYAIARKKNREYIAVVVVLTGLGRGLLKSHGKLLVNNKIKEYLSQYFELVVLPKQLRYVEAIPVNSQGKIVVSDVNSLFAEGARLNPGTFCIELKIPADSPYFQGHFPNNPILPGIAQLNLVAEYAKKHFGMPASMFCNIKQLKFTKIIRPDAIINLELAISDNVLTFKYYSDKGIHSSGKIRL